MDLSALIRGDGLLMVRRDPLVRDTLTAAMAECLAHKNGAVILPEEVPLSPR